MSMASAQTAFLQNMATLRLDPKCSDITLIWEGKAFPLHRAIVCPQSKIFTRELNSRYKESNGIIEHEHHDVNTVERMMSFLYTQDYPRSGPHEIPDLVESGTFGPTLGDPPIGKTTEGSTETFCQENLLVHIDVQSIATFYFIDPLKVASRDEFVECLGHKEWKTEDMVEVLIAVYQELPHDAGFRLPIVEACMYHVRHLARDEAFREALKEDRSSVWEFAFDFLQYARRYSDVRIEELIRDLEACKTWVTETEVWRQYSLHCLKRAGEIMKDKWACKQCGHSHDPLMEDKMDIEGHEFLIRWCCWCGTRLT